MPRIECLPENVLLALVITVGLFGCRKVDPNKGLNVKPTTRVTGTVLVDGEAPDTPVQIKAYPAESSAQDQPPSSGSSGKGGVLELSTYKTGDGLPVGEYKLTFVWTEMRLGGAALGGGQSDKLGGQYADPKKTPFTVTIEKSNDVVDIGVFELKKSRDPKKLEDDRQK
jgi:hypothetical protein